MAFHIPFLRVSCLLGTGNRSQHSSLVDCSMHFLFILGGNTIDGGDDSSQKPADMAIDQTCRQFFGWSS
eukprot:2776296-Ditylum_brightwellii.AAC.1